MATEKITIKQIRSSIRREKSQEATLRALGLGKIGRQIEHNKSPEIMGMVKKVGHLVELVLN